MDRKKPLYRKVNTRTHGVKHHKGGEARWDRNTKATKKNQSTKGSMHSKQQRGLDYTPLFKFLLSRVGKPWDEVFSEATGRLDKPDPIFWLVALNDAEKTRYVRVGESTYYSGLFVDGNGILNLVDPELTADSMIPFCGCCTHTFNGNRFTQKYPSHPIDIEQNP